MNFSATIVATSYIVTRRRILTTSFNGVGASLATVSLTRIKTGGYTILSQGYIIALMNATMFCDFYSKGNQIN